MRRTILAAMLVAVPTTAWADVASENAEPRISIDRLKEVAGDAETFCPSQGDNINHDALVAHWKEKGYSRAEAMLLLNFCLMYLNGRRTQAVRDLDR